MAFLTSLAGSAQAGNVVSEAGRLSNLIDDLQATALTVTGEVNAADIEFVAHELPQLASLDLKDATIVAYNGPKLLSGRTSSPAGCFPEYSFAGSFVRDIVVPVSLTAIGEGAFAASSVTAIELPHGVTTIGDAAFNGCHNLTTVKVTGSANIGAKAFKGCDLLRTVELADGIEVIETEAFNGCTALESIRLPETIKIVGDKAFNGCKSLADIHYGVQLQSIGEGAFSGTSIETLDLTECQTLKQLGSWAYAHNESLESVMLPESVTTLGDGVFFDCTALKRVVIPTALDRLAPYLLKGTALQDAGSVLKENVSEIGDYTFYGASEITNITLPSTLSSLGDMSMAGMSSLASVDATALSQVPTLGADVFKGTAGEDVTLLAKEDMADEFKATPQWKEFNVQVSQSTSSAENIADDSAQKILVKCDGITLWIKSGKAIERVDLHDMAGRLISHTAAGGHEEIAVHVGNLPARATVIAVIYYEDGHRGNVKIDIR